MRVEIGWKAEGYTTVELTGNELQLALDLGAQPDDAYSIIEALRKHNQEWYEYMTGVTVYGVFQREPVEFVSAVELTEED